MRYIRFITRNDPDEEWQFDYEPENVTLMGETLGCGCCANVEPIDKKNLLDHIERLEKALKEAKDLLPLVK